MAENVSKNYLEKSEKASSYLNIKTDPVVIRNRTHVKGTVMSFEGEAILICAKDDRVLEAFLKAHIGHVKFTLEKFKSVVFAEEASLKPFTVTEEA